jgi:hypothetical protein
METDPLLETVTHVFIDEVGRCSFTLSKPVLKERRLWIQRLKV